MPSSRSGRAPLLGAAILAATLVAYVPAMRGGFVWDDDAYVTQNEPLRSPGGLGRIWFDRRAEPQYYPLVHTSYWLEYRLWGADPTGYHVVNVLLHALNAVLFWRVLVRLGVGGAWFAALVFALHPVHVESAAWITERKNVLSGAFYLSSALAFWRVHPPEGKPGTGGRGYYALSLALFAGALLAKSVTASLPAALLVVAWWKRGRLGRGEVLAVLPMLVLGIVAGANTAYLERHHVGAGGAEWDLSFVDRCLIAGRAVWFYAAKLAWPHPLAFFYRRWEVDASAWWQYLFPLGAVVAVGAAWAWRERLGRGPLAAALFFGGTLLPALGFVDVYPMRYSFVADHFQYLASLGLIALFAAAATRASARLGRARRPAAAALLVVLGVLTWRQGRAYADPEHLWLDTVAKTPSSAAAHYNLALLLENEGDVAGAVRHYRAALDAKPDDTDTLTNLAGVLLHEGGAEEALPYYETALRIDPQHVTARYNLALALRALGRPDDAVREFREVLRLDPDAWQVHLQVARTYAEGDRLDAAEREYEAALAARPDSAEAHHEIGILFMRRGETERGIREFRETLRLDPDYPDAAEHLRRALGER